MLDGCGSDLLGGVASGLCHVHALRLGREDYWCRELCTYYPYGLNDNVRGIGNISKKPGLVVDK